MSLVCWPWVERLALGSEVRNTWDWKLDGGYDGQNVGRRAKVGGLGACIGALDLREEVSNGVP